MVVWIFNKHGAGPSFFLTLVSVPTIPIRLWAFTSVHVVTEIEKILILLDCAFRLKELKNKKNGTTDINKLNTFLSANWTYMAF